MVGGFFGWSLGGFGAVVGVVVGWFLELLCFFGFEEGNVPLLLGLALCCTLFSMPGSQEQYDKLIAMRGLAQRENKLQDKEKVQSAF